MFPTTLLEHPFSYAAVYSQVFQVVCLLSKRFSTKILYAPLPAPMRATYPANVILLYLMT
jgi:hypothetical protein